MTTSSQELLLEERVVRLHDYHQALAALSRAASETLPLDRLMHHVAARVARVTHIRRTKVLRYRPDRGDLLIEAGVGWKAGVVGQVSVGIDGASPAGRSLQTARPVVIADLPNDSEFRTSELLREHGIQSVLNVPILVDSRTWGVLEVDSEVQRGFDDGDIGFLTTAANILGIALLRFEIERRAAEEMAEQSCLRQASEVLRRELQHRTKNNLQTIISFVAIQRSHTENEETRARLASVISRVHAIALAHDQLTLRGATGEVEFGAYLRTLCANLDPQQPHLAFDLQVDDGILLTMDRAVPAGLIVNELVTNCLKYAFDEGGGIVRVSFSVDPDHGEAHLTIEDNGRGIGAKRAGGLGLTLVDAFARQLGGRISAEPVEKGTRTSICFPLPM